MSEIHCCILPIDRERDRFVVRGPRARPDAVAPNEAAPIRIPPCPRLWPLCNTLEEGSIRPGDDADCYGGVSIVLAWIRAVVSRVVDAPLIG